MGATVTTPPATSGPSAPHRSLVNPVQPFGPPKERRTGLKMGPGKRAQTEPIHARSARYGSLERPISTAHALSPAHGREYEAFPNVEARNGLQERIEIPLMLRALGLEKGGRILEVGCGRGIAFRVFAELPTAGRRRGRLHPIRTRGGEPVLP